MYEARAVFEIQSKKEHYRRVLPLNEPHRIMRAAEVLAEDHAEHLQRDEDGHLSFMKDKRTMEAKILRGLFLWESAGGTTPVFKDEATNIEGHAKHYSVSVSVESSSDEPIPPGYEMLLGAAELTARIEFLRANGRAASFPERLRLVNERLRKGIEAQQEALRQEAR